MRAYWNGVRNALHRIGYWIGNCVYVERYALFTTVSKYTFRPAYAHIKARIGAHQGKHDHLIV